MYNLIETLRDTYATNPAAALNMLPELFKADKERKAILASAILTYGIQVQEDICIEEMSELTKALLKHRRNSDSSRIKDIREEIADVQIMLDQMRLIYGDTAEQEEFKLNRLKERLECDNHA